MSDVTSHPWWADACRLRVGLIRRPQPQVPRLTRPKYDAELAELDRFAAWVAWNHAGRPKPRPKTFWARVPSPIYDKVLREYETSHPRQKPPPPAPPPPAPPKPPTTRDPAKGRGVLYYYNSANAKHDVVAEAVRHGFAVALLVHEGADIVYGHHNDGDLIDRLRHAGVPFIATGWIKPFTDYDLIARNLAAFLGGRAAEYMANVESAWGYPAPGFGESEKLVPILRKHLGQLPLSAAIENRQPLHYRPWLDAGADVFRPECYLNQAPDQLPLTALKAAMQAQADLPHGLRPDQVEPLLGRYGEWQQPLATWRSAVADVVRLGAGPPGVWAAEFCPPDDLAALAAMRSA